MYKFVGANDLSVNDIVVKSSQSELACIKARFSLAIKVETLLSEENPSSSGEEGRGSGSESENENRLTLGYLPLDSIVNVQDTCPEPKADSDQTVAGEDKEDKEAERKELEMVVKFECGHFRFNFRQSSESFYTSSIRGLVHLDSKTTEEFVSNRDMFFTSDLTHHFKFNDLIEVHSTERANGFILTANFYNLELETFRGTTSRSFIRPSDDNSKPFKTSED